MTIILLAQAPNLEHLKLGIKESKKESLDVQPRKADERICTDRRADVSRYVSAFLFAYYVVDISNVSEGSKQ